MAAPDEPGPTPELAPEASEKRAKGKPAAEAAMDGVLVAFTIDTASGRIARVESVDAAGGRRELTAEEKNRLLARAGGVTLEGVVERAFEAGLECAFGEDEQDEPDEALPTPSEADVTLRHLVLRSLMADTVADRLIKREVLNRAIAGTLIRQGVGGQSGHAH